MDWTSLTFDFISALADALAWPAAVAIIVFVLRHEIRRLIGELSRFRYGQLEMDFGREIKMLQQSADEASLPLTPAAKQDGEQRVRQMPVDSYRGIVLDVWLKVEDALLKAADEHDLGLGANPPVARVIAELEKRDVFPAEIADVFRNARALRNDAAHSRDFGITVEAVEVYVGLTGRLLALLAFKAGGLNAPLSHGAT